MEHFSDVPREEPDVSHAQNSRDAGGSFEGGEHETLLTPATSDAITHQPEYLPPTMPGFVPYTETRPQSELEVRAAERRERVMREIGHLDIALDPSSQVSVRHYAQALGLDQAEAINIEGPEAVTAVNRAITRVPFMRSIGKNTTGVYVPELGLAVMTRDAHQDYGQLVRSNVREAIGHGSRGVSPGLFKYMAKILLHPESNRYVEGFQNVRGGKGLEDGFAHIIGTEYARATGILSSTEYKSPSPELSNATGVNPTPESEPVPTPAAYSGQHLYDGAAKAFLVLCEAQPHLMEVAFASRRDDVEKAEFGAMVDAIEPGLYDRMLAVGNGIQSYKLAEDFEDALWDALAAANLRDEDVQAICDHGQGVSYIAKKLAEYEQATNYSFR